MNHQFNDISLTPQYRAKPEDNLAVVLNQVRGKGVRIWVENGNLRYKAPRNALTSTELETLRREREQILQILGDRGETSASRSRVSPEIRVHRAPLTYSQLQHWNLYGLREQPGLRHLVSATRLCGNLDLDGFRESVASVVRRHDALRTRIVVSDLAPLQEIEEGLDWQLKVEDLAALGERDREAQIYSRIERIVLAPIDLAKGPLFEARLLRMHNEEHVLVVAMEHIIADMWSLDVFFEDVLKAYGQVRQGKPPSLPKLLVQFSDYAIWQHNQQASWREEHEPYWQTRMHGCRRLHFPCEDGRPINAGSGWRIAPVHLDEPLISEMRSWCRARGTTLVMTIFSAYIALVLRWCHVLDTVIRFESNGRFQPQVERTIGYFTAPLFLRVQLRAGDSLDVLLNKVTDEYCRALEHADASYLEAQTPRPEFTRNTAFNWIPRGSSEQNNTFIGVSNELTYRTVPFENPRLKHLERDTEPFALLFESNSCIEGGIWYPAHRFSNFSMQTFGRNFLSIIRALLSDAGQPVNAITLR